MGVATDLFFVSFLYANEFYIFGTIALISRMLHFPSSIYIMIETLNNISNNTESEKIKLIDNLDRQFFYDNSRVYGLAVFFSLFDCKILRFLPWYLTFS